MDSGKRRGAQRSYPERAHALGLLETWERQAYLGAPGEAPRRVALDSDIKAWVWRGILTGMPEKLDDEQLKAWARLAKLASGENRIEALREQTRPVWVQARGALDSTGWGEAVKAAVEEAARAIR